MLTVVVHRCWHQLEHLRTKTKSLCVRICAAWLVCRLPARNCRHARLPLFIMACVALSARQRLAIVVNSAVVVAALQSRRQRQKRSSSANGSITAAQKDEKQECVCVCVFVLGGLQYTNTETHTHTRVNVVFRRRQ